MDDVYYNIAAIKAYEDNMIKYITFREKLPKVEIAVHGHTFELWNENEKLPEMAPFNMDHTVHEDVLNYQSRPQNMEDKLGTIKDASAWKVNEMSLKNIARGVKSPLTLILVLLFSIGIGTASAAVPVVSIQASESNVCVPHDPYTKR